MKLFNKPIHREDLLPVIQSGIFIAIVSGLLVGAIKLMVEETFGLYLQLIFTVVIAFYIARRIKNAYQEYHIVYSIIGIFAYIIAFYIMNVTYLIGFFFMRNIDVFSWELLRIILNPLYSFSFFDVRSPLFFEIENILELIFFLVGSIYTFIKTK
ncbi:MAG: hypothetical protein EP317_02350 [Bacillota bacterium]|nr:MAG: hypothetical protein EP317_02350 [Bacillota bacterium]